VLNDDKKSYLIWELPGASSIIPVISYSFSASIFMDFPIGLVSPKYFPAVFFDKITV